MVIWVMTADDELFTSTSSSNTKTTPNPVLEMSPILSDVEMTPVDQTVIPETFQKKDKQKARVTNDKQVKNQSIMANPGAQTSAKNPDTKKPMTSESKSETLLYMIFCIPGTLRKS
ncbi:hypothetical protein RhiirA5_437412 [Rhizophagus irregularis]|uniref:Uncharacterized protein n=1 Tax=Rhizophagus irregularis TaxID=588596 RepID=A0A2N0NKI1_9GLOM|nr:hypothetical protein RhiirA5_437412 [Rhizophagus irregularis]